MNKTNEYISNAELAMNNGQFETALSWYKKALAEEPDNLYALSRAGAASVQLKQFDGALGYFSKAIELDPKNGDNYFNLANMYFFNENISKAFELYVEAERIGCGNDVVLQLNYHLMLICSYRQDIKSALVYLKKCEKLDTNGVITLTPDFISEKVKLYMIEKDFDNAEKCAAQLVAIDPSNYRSQSVYYSLLMVSDKYAEAMRVIDDIETYVELNSDEKVTLAAQKSALYLVMAESGNGSNEENYRLAEEVLEDKLADSALTAAQRNLLSVTLAELYYKSEKYDAAIELSEGLLPVSEYVPNDESTGIVEDDAEYTASRFEIEREIELNMRKIDRSGIRVDLQRVRGDDGNVEYKLSEEDSARLLDKMGDESSPVVENSAELPEYEAVSLEQLEKVYFVLISCHMAKDEYANASKYATILKHSENKYYAYFGLYTETLASKYLIENSEEVELNYAKAIAYFKNRILTDYTDSLAALFRVRLYAEMGKFEKAEELANVLAEEDRAAALNYIREWREKQ